MICNILSHFSEWFSEASNSITAIAAIAAAAFAYIGLQTWRHQLKGASEYALAKEILKAVYRVREAFKHVRNPAIFSYEYPKEMRLPDGHLKEDLRADGTGHAYEKRFKVLSEAFLSLEDKNLDAQVEYGSEYADVIVPIRKCRVELQIALQDHIESLRRTYDRPRSTAQELQEKRSVMYYLGEAPSEHDLFTPQINTAIAEFETRLRPIIGKRKS